jgi:hypothetical protein
MNLKRWWLWLFCFLCSACAVAQTISVTATITDSDSQTWNYGSGFVQLVSPNGPPFYSGTAVSTAPQVLTFNSSGALAVTLYNTSTITPTGAQYRWTLCSWTSAPCTTFLTSVTTANLSTLLSGLVAAPRFNSAPAAYGYADVEVIAPPYPGGGYFNVNSSASRQCVLTPPSTTCTWQNGGSGGSGFPIILGSTSIAASSTTTTIGGLTLTAPTFTTPALGTIASGNIAAATGLTPGQVTTALGFNPGAQPNVVTTSTFTFSGAAGFYDNENSTAGTAVTGTLPTASVSPVVLQYCFDNANNGSAANTGVLTFQTSATGQYIIFTDGTLSASGGYVSSGGAARDAGCVRAVDSTHWMFYTNTGTWTKH